jgi:hypothetical protein
MIHAIPSDPNTIVYTRVWGCSVSHRQRGKRRARVYLMGARRRRRHGEGCRLRRRDERKPREREGGGGGQRERGGVNAGSGYGKLAPLTASLSLSRCGNFNAASFVLKKRRPSTSSR